MHRRKIISPRGKPWASIIALMLLIVGLVVLFVYLFTPKSRPAPVVKIIQAPDYDLLEVIPNDFADSDRQLFDASKVTIYADDYDATDLRSQGDLDSVAQKLKDHFDSDRKDGIALLLISAHGVSLSAGDEVEAYFLTNEFSFGEEAGEFSTQSTVGISKLAGLIEAFESITAATKVLLIDSSRITSDFRLGMGVNEFPFLLERLVAESEDEGMWVICSTGMMEQSLVSYREGNSLFARAVNESFLSLGDKRLGENDEVSLTDFYKAIVRYCHSYAPRGTAYAQTPILMHGGHGFVDGGQGDDDQWDAADDTTVFYRTLDLEEEESAEDGGESGDEESGDEDTAKLDFGPRQFAPPSRLAMTSPVHSLLSRVAARRRAMQDDDASGGQDSSDSSDDGTGAGQDQDGNQDESGSSSSQDDDPDDSGDADNAADAANEGNRANSNRDVTDGGAIDGDPYARLETLSDLQRTILDCWELRDRLEGRVTVTRISPIDIAPDLWTRIAAQIARLGRIARASDPGSGRFANAVRDIGEIKSQLECMVALANGEAAPRFQGENNDIGVLLITTWENFNRESNTAAYQAWLSQSSSDRSVIDSLQMYYDILFRAKYYVTWYREVSPIQSIAFDSDLSELIDGLERARVDFEKVTFGDQTLGLSDVAITLERRVSSLSRDEKGVYNHLIDLFEKARSLEEAGEDLVAGELAAALLNSPLLPATPRFMRQGQQTDSTTAVDQDFKTTRVEVLDLIEKISKKPSPELAEAPALPSSREFYGDLIRWERAAERLEFQKSLLQLVDPDSLASLQIPTPGAEINEDNIESTLAGFREASQAIQAAYFDLLEKALATDDPAYDKYWDRRMASVIDPRDYRIFNPDNIGVPELTLIQKTLPERLAFERPRHVKAMVNADESLVLKLTANDIKGSKITLHVDEMNEDLFDIKVNGDPVSASGAPGSKSEITINYRSTRSLYEIPVEITAKYNQTEIPPGISESKPALVLTARGMEEDSAVSTQLRYTSHLPHLVDLMVVHAETTETVPAINADFPASTTNQRLLIRPYTGKGRLSPFELHLLNRSREEKTAKVELYEVKRPNRPFALLPGRVSNSDDPVHKDIRDNVLALIDDEILLPFAASADIVLPPANEPFPNEQVIKGLRRQVVLTPPPIGGAEDGEAPPPNPEDTSDISHGILCRITVAGIEKSFDKWIELTPQRPENYLDLDDTLEIVQYKARNGEVTMEIDRRRDGIWADYPFKFFGDIEIELVPDRESPLYEGGKEIGTINADNRASVYQRISSDVLDFDRPEVMQMIADVDSYPRAIAYDVMVGPTNDNGEESRKRLKRVRIREVIAIREDQDPETLAPTPDGMWPLGPADKLLVHFEIDGPLEVFTRVNADRNYIEVAWQDLRGRGQTEKFFFDRQVSHQASLAKKGTLNVQTTVTDISHEFNVRGVRNPITLSARLVLDEGVEEEDRQTASLPLVFDFTNPEITRFEFENGEKEASTPQNRPLKVVLGVRDEDSRVVPGGVRFFWSDKENPPFAFDEGHMIQDLPLNESGDRWVLTVRPETIGRTGEVWLIPRVEDQVGLVTDELEEPLRPLALNILPPVEEGSGGNDGTGGSEMTEEKLFTLDVEVTWGFSDRNPRKRESNNPPVKFTLEGPTNASAEPQTSPEKFLFRNLKPGTYKLTASMETSQDKYSFEEEFVIAEDREGNTIEKTIFLKREDRNSD